MLQIKPLNWSIVSPCAGHGLHEITAENMWELLLEVWGKRFEYYTKPTRGLIKVYLQFLSDLLLWKQTLDDFTCAPIKISSYPALPCDVIIAFKHWPAGWNTGTSIICLYFVLFFFWLHCSWKPSINSGIGLNSNIWHEGKGLQCWKRYIHILRNTEKRGLHEHT